MDNIVVTIQLTRYQLIEILETVLNEIDPDPAHKKILLALDLITETKGGGGRSIFPTDKVDHIDGFAKDYEVLGISLEGE